MRATKALGGLLILAVLGAGPGAARAEEPGLAAARDRYMRGRIGLMSALSAWAALDVIGGAVLWAKAPPDPPRRAQQRWFAATAVAYGLINGVIAVNTLATLDKTRKSLTSAGAVAEQRRQSSNVFAVNVGVEMLSIGVGAAVWALSPSKVAQGTAAGVTLHGLLLVGFDTAGTLVYRY